jgi:hypothetical protein
MIIKNYTKTSVKQQKYPHIQSFFFFFSKAKNVFLLFNSLWRVKELLGNKSNIFNLEGRVIFLLCK